VAEGNNRPFRIIFKDEFDLCLDRIENFFSADHLWKKQAYAAELFDLLRRSRT
jgi:hypothetical protein